MYIGIDVGGTNIKAGLVDENGRIINKSSVPTQASRGYEEIIADMAKAAKMAAGDKLSEVKSIGIGIPGSCDDEAGIIPLACNLGFRNVPIREEMAKHISTPIHIGNDANCAALGEYYMMSGERPQSMVFVTLGTGVGGGIVIDGKLYTGFNSTAGEIGHIMLVKDGRKCGCGRNGCWEAYGSVTGLITSTKEAIAAHPESIMCAMAEKNGVSGRTAFDAARQGDSTARDVVDNWIICVAEGIIDIINLFQPEVICIGGAISAESDMILTPLKKYVDQYKYNGSDKETKIEIAKYGNDAGLIGAAFLGKEE